MGLKICIGRYHLEWWWNGCDLYAKHSAQNPMKTDTSFIGSLKRTCRKPLTAGNNKNSTTTRQNTRSVLKHNSNKHRIKHNSTAAIMLELLCQTNSTHIQTFELQVVTAFSAPRLSHLTGIHVTRKWIMYTARTIQLNFFYNRAYATPNLFSPRKYCKE